MKTKINYKDETGRTAAMETNAGLRLAEDARHDNGNYLIFTDELEGVAVKSLEETVALLEARVVALENPVA